MKNTIYTDNRTGKRYVLEPRLTMGDKLCLRSMDSCEDKFYAPSTLKRWFSKYSIDKHVVEMRAFTGMKIGMFIADGTFLTTLTVTTKKGARLTFDRNGDQIDAKNPKFANKLAYAM